MKNNIAILTIGNEILDGRIQDTNSSYLANELHKSGYSVSGVLSCADNIDDICDGLQFLFTKAHSVITTGGLGPTDDDLTCEAFAQFFNSPLVHVDSLERHLRDFYKKRNRSFEESNLKQALVPTGAKILPNPNGTAAGILVSTAFNDGGIRAFALPGVPSEFKAMVKSSVLPIINSLIEPKPPKTEIHLQCFGISESVAGRKIRELELPENIHVSYRASFPILRIRASSHDDIDASLRATLRETLDADFIFSEDESGSLEETVHELLHSTNNTLSLAESCTGGMISSFVTRQAGSSAYFLGGAVTYSNEAKEALLNVPGETLLKYGAVSFETAQAMARGALMKFGSSLALSVTGIAGPTGGSDEKPVGTFFVGLACESETFGLKYFYPGSRSGVRRYATHASLDLIRRHLLGLPLDSVAIKQVTANTNVGR